MGWNTGYTIFEATVIGAYDQGKLDKELLAVLMEPYRGTDIDSGGRQGLLTKDGKDIEQVTIETFGLTMPEKPVSERQEWRPGFTDEELEAYERAEAPWEDWYESVAKLLDEVTNFFGWR